MSEKKTFSELFQLLLKVQEPKSRNTFLQCQGIIKHLEPWFKKNCPHLDDFVGSHEEMWASYKVDQAKIRQTLHGKTNQTRRLGHDRRYLIMALHRAHKKKWISEKYAKSDFDLNEARDPIGKYVEDADIKKLLQALEIHPQTRLQFLMAVTMGMRLSEILKLRKDEVSLVKKEIKLDPNRLKTRQARKVEIPISDEVYPTLKEFMGLASGDYVFPMERDPTRPQRDNRHWWTLARKKAGVKMRFHDARHTAITNAVAAGIPTEWISQVFGATPQVLSRIYSHLRSEDKEQFRTLFKGRFK